MNSAGSERRRYRRVPLSVHVLARRSSTAGQGAFEAGETQDVSLGGMYFTTAAWRDVQPQDMLTLSVSVPRDHTRDFPFSRLAGRGRVVRVDRVRDHEPGPPQLGIAVEFADDLTMLTAAPEHGW